MSLSSQLSGSGIFTMHMTLNLFLQLYPKLAIINNGSMGEEYNSSFQAFPFSAFIAKPYCDLAVFSMRKSSTLQCALLRFGVPLMLIVIFCATSSAQVSGNEMNTQTEELTKTNINGHDEDAKFKFFHPKPVVYKKPIPIYKPVPKVIPIVKPIPKVIPVVKPVPIPVYKPIPKPVPIVKPIPKPIPVVKPVPIPVYKPIPKPFHPKFEKPHHPHFLIHPKFEKPHHPHFPIHKP
ncbi:hypothetical protein VNO77_39441 [Canavalia gladiata]|uniref:Uncharacterized protein n=1 Tax=Canavalia gladiata TaxID=3824 RepID=A0AAN9KCK9_CANGL